MSDRNDDQSRPDPVRLPPPREDRPELSDYEKKGLDSGGRDHTRER